jgi:hypothetical protein
VLKGIPAASHRDLLSAVTDFVATLPPGSAEVQTSEATDFAGSLMTIRPADNRAAPVSVAVSEDLAVVDVHVGRDTTFELAAAEPDGTLDTYRTKLLDILAGVAAGGLTETLWYDGETLLRSHAVLPRDERSLEAGHQHAVAGARTGGRREIVRYRPYYHSGAQDR